MKKFYFFSMLALLCAGAVFAQSGKKNALSFDVAPLFRGFVAKEDNPDNEFFGGAVFYERLLGSRYSLGGRFDFILGEYLEMDTSYLAGSLHGRVYPLAQGLEKLYLDVGIGFNNIDRDGVDDVGGLTFALTAGYKHFFNGFIFVEPSLGLVYAKTISGNRTLRDPSPIEWTPGLHIGFSF
jgi:hypothetical protein